MPDTQTTDRELWVLAGYLHEAYQQAEPGHRLLAAAQAADEWARERYEASIELLRQHTEMTERVAELEAENANIRPVYEAACVWVDHVAAARHLTSPASDLRHAVELAQRPPEPQKASIPRLCSCCGCWPCYYKSSGEEPVEMARTSEGKIRFLAEALKNECDRAASLADRVMAAEGERDKLRKRVNELSAICKADCDLLEKRGEEVRTLQGRLASLEMERSVLQERVNLRSAVLDLHNKLMEGERSEWQESVDEVSAEAQLFHRLYARELGKVAALEARLADYDHQAEQAETYRRLYAQTLAKLEEVQGGERRFTWIPFSEREPHDGYLVELMPGWQQVIWHTGANRGTATHWREVQHGE